MSDWTIGSVLKWAAGDFQKRGFDAPRLEAEVLLGHVLACERIKLYTDYDRPLDEVELAAYRAAITRRREGVPAAYITGAREFWSLEIRVDERVLVPRPETELLVEAALDRWSGGFVLDLCTGSGCVPVALASERAEMVVDAIDISEEACAVARANVAAHDLGGRVTVLAGDLFAPVPQGRAYTVITANPPYVTDDEWAELSREVQKEPRLALVAGGDGLDVIRRIVAGAGAVLEAGGSLAIELDPRQVPVVIDEGLWKPAGFAQVDVLNDLAGDARVVVYRSGECT